MGVKRIATEVILGTVDRIPSLLRSKTDQLAQLIEMIFINMIDIDEDIDQKWISPPEGFNEDIEEDEDFEVNNEVRGGPTAYLSLGTR